VTDFREISVLTQKRPSSPWSTRYAFQIYSSRSHESGTRSSKESYISCRASLTVSVPQRKHWAIRSLGKLHKLRSVCYPLLQRQGFRRPQRRGGQNSELRRTRKRSGIRSSGKLSKLRSAFRLQPGEQEFQRRRKLGGRRFRRRRIRKGKEAVNDTRKRNRKSSE